MGERVGDIKCERRKIKIGRKSLRSTFREVVVRMIQRESENEEREKERKRVRR